MELRLPQRRGLRVVLALGLLLALLAADGVYAGLRFRSSFKAAACNLKRATDRIQELNVDRGIERLRMADELVSRSRGYLRHPSVSLATFLPSVGDDVRALKALGGVAEAAIDAGLEGAEAAESMGLAGSGSLSALYNEGKVRFEPIAEGVAALGSAQDHLAEAEAILDEAPTPSIGQVRNAFFGAARIVTDALGQVEKARRVMSALPGLLGANGARRYFLAFQTPTEARGGGGLVGVYGILEIDDGRLDLVKIEPIRNLVPALKGSIEMPGWFRDLYGTLDALGGWREANLTPTFPASSEALLKMYDLAFGERLDGVIAMDPYVVQDLTRGTGPIRAPGLDVEVGPENAAQVLLYDIYLEFIRREDEQNAYLRRLVNALWDELGSGDVDGTELAKGLARSIRTQHLKMYSTDPVEQEALGDAGLSGDPRHFGSNVQMVFHNNFAANKVDYFLQRSQEITVVLDEEGNADVVTTVQMRNDAPRGELGVLKKSDLNELPAGLNRMGLFYLLPEGAEIEEFYTGSISNTYIDGVEAGVYPVAWKVLDIQVQSQIQNAISYRVPQMVEIIEGRGRFEMSLLPHVLVNPDEVALRVVPPPGFRVGRDESGARYSEEPFTFEGSLKSPRTIELNLIGPGEPLPAGTNLASACA